MMLVLLLCVIMKIAEFSVGRGSPPLPSMPGQQVLPVCCNKRKRRYRNQHNRNTNDRCKCISLKRTVKGTTVMEDPQTPGSDCNSNPADPISQDLIGSEFVQDNSEYQWFIDYGYRDGGLHVHPSVLSSLSTSYTQDDLGYYDDLARNLDANLAEVDMESFRTADIHTLLTALPVMCTDPVQHSEFNYQRERYASISGSVMEKIDIGSSISPHSSSQGEDSACSTTDTISICKSSLLFSPVKETPVLPPGGSYSVDSLDCEDMLLTCQTNNKNNYTIAFEGSMTMYSDGSQDFESQEKQKMYEARETYYNTKHDLKNILDLSMACSDSKIYTTWSNLKHSSSNKVMTRHPSGNNNTIPNFLTGVGNLMLSSHKRSLSLPDLTKTRELQRINVPLNFSIDSADCNVHPTNLHSSGSAMSRSINEDSTGSVDHAVTGKKLQNLSLVRLFMKQKSMSAEGMSLTLDQSDSVSESGWPTSNSDSGTANTNTQIPRRNINAGDTTSNGDVNDIPENDFSINWVKTDCYKSCQDASSSENTSKRVASIVKDLKEESPSVEELSESLLKSGTENSKNFCINETRNDDDNDDDDDTRPKDHTTSNVLSNKDERASKTTGIQAIIEVADNGVQTSLIYPMTGKIDYPHLRETIVDKKPVYVVYPNYTLPDLSFLNTKDGCCGNSSAAAAAAAASGIENVALKPQVYEREKTGCKRTVKGARPFSCNDIDALRQRGFAHVKDWESLTFLLPTEYKKVLQDLPEVSHHMRLSDETKKPLFCLSPPMRHRSRTISEIIPSNVSSSSSSGTQLTSGYRGSSTILTDSSSNQQITAGTNANPLYLYRYDSMSSAEASLVGQEKKSHRSLVSGRQGNSTFSKRSISLPQGDNSEIQSNGKVPPRPPLPKSILRKNRSAANKRYSMFEMGGVEEVDDRQSPEPSKRMSLQEPYCINNDLQMLRNGRIIDSEKDVDEVEERRYAERLRETGNYGNNESDGLDSSLDDVKQLEEFLKRSGFSSQSSDGDNEDPDVKLRSYVRKFLSLRMNKDIGKTTEMLESQKKTVSFAVHQRKAYLANKAKALAGLVDTRECPGTLDSPSKSVEPKPIDLEEKKKMMWSVNKAVDLLVKYWHTQPLQSPRDYIDKNECAQLCVSNLCPALYAIMSDGLKPQLNSTFGPIANSVWQVVEASSQQGPLTNTLNELVQKINGEDFITEGMLKFHAFVFGLLNLRALDAWFAYLCTRETILRKHYSSNSLFVGALACPNAREVADAFLNILQPLAFCPFQLDLLYQYRQLHNSFGNMNNHAATNNSSAPFRIIESPKDHQFEITDIPSVSPSPKKIRPRSCVAYYNDDKRSIAKNDADIKKRWSHLPGGAKMYPGLDKLTSEDSEDYTDSLEHAPFNRPGSSATRQNIPNGISSPDVRQQADDEDSIPRELKFRKLQEKWELMVEKDDTRDLACGTIVVSPNQTPTSASKSKIPRLLTSPVKQSSVPINGKMTKSPISGIPSLMKKPTNVAATKLTQKKSVDAKIFKDVTRRTSRVDQDTVGPARILTRPSSLPYKSHGVTARDKSLVSPHRRAASTSLPRPTAPSNSRANAITKQPVKEVRTLTHRLPSDNGHLSFNEGERLKVILEVDNKWLLCARGDRKGLVPRSCVHPLHS